MCVCVCLVWVGCVLLVVVGLLFILLFLVVGSFCVGVFFICGYLVVCVFGFVLCSWLLGGLGVVLFCFLVRALA